MTRTASLIDRGLLGVGIDKAHLLLPGLALTVLLALAATRLSGWIGVSLLGFSASPVSPVILAIALGMILRNAVRFPAVFEKGWDLSVRKVLRLGIILLGIRLSVFDVVRLGAVGIPIVMMGIAGAVLLTGYLARRLALPARLGTLIAVGTSICGVSAIVAAAPAIEAEEEEVCYAIAVITMFGLAATLLYPYLAYAIFRHNAVLSGPFLGTAIHETAQVAGAGMIYADAFASPAGLDVAMVAKMVRNVFMAAVIPLLAFLHARRQSSPSGRRGPGAARLFPLFIAGFVAMAVFRSIGDAEIGAGRDVLGLWGPEAWSGLQDLIKSGAAFLLVVALAGVGLKTRFASFKGLGLKPFLVGLGSAAAVGIVSFLTISLFGRWISV
ncbi:MAG: putative sulfate exporter family transporter [Candidatus Aminicenantes bacterium]|nr:putative sulfate exporter family transporter [Candidatus Aminicenantes bacterium]